MGLASVLAELVGTQDVWRKTLTGLNMLESPFLKQIEDQAKAEARVEDLLRFLEKRFKGVPDDLRTAILAVKDLDRLTPWIDLAATSRTLRSFRKQAGV
jgi:hypothetical protein